MSSDKRPREEAEEAGDRPSAAASPLAEESKAPSSPSGDAPGPGTQKAHKIQTNRWQCNDEVYQKGYCIAVLGAPASAVAQQLVDHLNDTCPSDNVYDWHYVGGRVCVLYLGEHADAEAELLASSDRFVAMCLAYCRAHPLAWMPDEHVKRYYRLGPGAIRPPGWRDAGQVMNLGH